jgi:hypothetical protein
MATPEEIAALKEGIASLNAAIASGTRSVTLRGQTITYNTTASLIQARDDLRNQLNAATGVTGRRRQSYGYQSGRGY